MTQKIRLQLFYNNSQENKLNQQRFCPPVNAPSPFIPTTAGSF